MGAGTLGRPILRIGRGRGLWSTVGTAALGSAVQSFTGNNPETGPGPGRWFTGCLGIVGRDWLDGGFSTVFR